MSFFHKKLKKIDKKQLILIKIYTFLPKLL